MVSKIGRSEIGNDPQEPNASDPVVSLKPMDEWTTAETKTELDQAVRKRLEKVPGATFLLSQPIQQRVDELLSGVRSEATVKVLGDDLNVLRKTGEQISAIMSGIRGVADVRIEQLFGQVYLAIDIDRGKSPDTASMSLRSRRSYRRRSAWRRPHRSTKAKNVSI